MTVFQNSYNISIVSADDLSIVMDYGPTYGLWPYYTCPTQQKFSLYCLKVTATTQVISVAWVVQCNSLGGGGRKEFDRG